MVGEEAKRRVVSADNIIFDSKRLLGQVSCSFNFQEHKETYPFNLIDHQDHVCIEVKYKNEQKIFEPKEISAIILKQLKIDSERHLNKSINQAVITVPAYFNDVQKEETIIASKIAGFHEIRIITEPTAAAVAYGLSNKFKEPTNILVYDFGGGTFDVTLLRCDNDLFQVIGTDGDTRLGGNDIDNQFLKYVIKKLKLNFPNDKMYKKKMYRLRLLCEQAKHDLSVKPSVMIDLEEIDESLGSVEITLNEFQESVDEVC